MKWVVTEKFRDYLYYAPGFTVYSDNNPLTYVLSTAKLNATGHRWVSELADFNFKIHYRPGKENGDADYLSRLPLDFEKYMQPCTTEVNHDVIHATINAAQAQYQGKTAWINSFSVPRDLPQYPENSPDLGHIDQQELRVAQQDDPAIGPVMRWKLSGRKPSAAERQKELHETNALMFDWKKLAINKGILLRKTGTRSQIVLPRKYCPVVYQELHQKLGHVGADRVTALARDRFFWPHMKRDIEHFVQKACPCLKQRKPARHTRAPLMNLTSTMPFDLVSIDYVHLEKSKGGAEYLLVIVDHFTRFAQAFPTRNKGGRTAAEKIFNNYVLRYGFPRRLHHDQGQEFECNLMKRLQQLAGMKLSRTTPYHPQGNGQAERWNRTILSMLRTLTESQKANWKDHVDKVVFAYNYTRNDATGYSPFYLLYGRSPRLPIDIMFEIDPDHEVTSYQDYVLKWIRGMQQAFELASQHAKKRAAHNKQIYDRGLYGSQLTVGDRVLVRNLRERGGPREARTLDLGVISMCSACMGKPPLLTELDRGQSNIV